MPSCCRCSLLEEVESESESLSAALLAHTRSPLKPLTTTQRALTTTDSPTLSPTLSSDFVVANDYLTHTGVNTNTNTNTNVNIKMNTNINTHTHAGADACSVSLSSLLESTDLLRVLLAFLDLSALAGLFVATSRRRADEFCRAITSFHTGVYSPCASSLSPPHTHSDEDSMQGSTHSHSHSHIHSHTHTHAYATNEEYFGELFTPQRAFSPAVIAQLRTLVLVAREHENREFLRAPLSFPSVLRFMTHLTAAIHRDDGTLHALQCAELLVVDVEKHPLHDLLHQRRVSVSLVSHAVRAQVLHLHMQNLRYLLLDSPFCGVAQGESALEGLRLCCPLLERVDLRISLSLEDFAFFADPDRVWPSLRALDVGPMLTSFANKLDLQSLFNEDEEEEEAREGVRDSVAIACAAVAAVLTRRKFPALQALEVFAHSHIVCSFFQALVEQWIYKRDGETESEKDTRILPGERLHRCVSIRPESDFMRLLSAADPSLNSDAQEEEREKRRAGHSADYLNANYSFYESSFPDAHTFSHAQAHSPTSATYTHCRAVSEGETVRDCFVGAQLSSLSVSSEDLVSLSVSDSVAAYLQTQRALADRWARLFFCDCAEKLPADPCLRRFCLFPALREAVFAPDLPSTHTMLLINCAQTPRKSPPLSLRVHGEHCEVLGEFLQHKHLLEPQGALWTLRSVEINPRKISSLSLHRTMLTLTRSLHNNMLSSDNTVNWSEARKRRAMSFFAAALYLHSFAETERLCLSSSLARYWLNELAARPLTDEKEAGKVLSALRCVELHVDCVTMCGVVRDTLRRWLSIWLAPGLAPRLSKLKLRCQSQATWQYFSQQREFSATGGEGETLVKALAQRGVRVCVIYGRERLHLS